MKKTIIRVVFLVLCGACGAGAFFLFRAGTAQYEEERKPQLIGLTDLVIQEGCPLPESINHVRVKGDIQKSSVRADTSEVQTARAGIYPIRYTYTGKDGTQYTEEIKCIVEPNKNDVPESGTQARQQDTQEAVPPRTGDELAMVFYILLIILSAALTGSVVRYRMTPKKI